MTRGRSEKLWWPVAIAAAFASVAYLRLAGAGLPVRPDIHVVARNEAAAAASPERLDFLCVGGAFFDLRLPAIGMVLRGDTTAIREERSTGRCRPPGTKRLNRLRPIVAAASIASGYGAMLARADGGREAAMRESDAVLRASGWREIRGSGALRSRARPVSAGWYEKGGGWMLVVVFDPPGSGSATAFFAGRWETGMERP